MLITYWIQILLLCFTLDDPQCGEDRIKCLDKDVRKMYSYSCGDTYNTPFHTELSWLW